MSTILPTKQVRPPFLPTQPVQHDRAVKAPEFFGMLLALLGFVLMLSTLIAVLIALCRAYRRNHRAALQPREADIEMARCSDETDRSCQTFGTTDSGMTLCMRKPSPVRTA